MPMLRPMGQMPMEQISMGQMPMGGAPTSTGGMETVPMGGAPPQDASAPSGEDQLSNVLEAIQGVPLIFAVLNSHADMQGKLVQALQLGGSTAANRIIRLVQDHRLRGDVQSPAAAQAALETVLGASTA